MPRPSWPLPPTSGLTPNTPGSAKDVEEFVDYDVLREYGRDMVAARRQYRAYVQACLMEDDAPMLEAMAASRYAIGGPAFIAQTEARLEERRSGRLQDGDVDLPRWNVPLDELDAAVARHYGVGPALLAAHGHRAGPAKAVAVELAARLADVGSREIGLRYGIGAAAVSAIHRRLTAASPTAPTYCKSSTSSPKAYARSDQS